MNIIAIIILDGHSRRENVSHNPVEGQIDSGENVSYFAEVTVAFEKRKNYLPSNRCYM